MSVRAMVWAKYDEVLSVLAPPATLARRGEHVGDPAAIEKSFKPYHLKNHVLILRG